MIIVVQAPGSAPLQSLIRELARMWCGGVLDMEFGEMGNGEDAMVFLDFKVRCIMYLDYETN